MQIFIQWARRNPQDYQPLGSEVWATTASKPDPTRSTPYELAELNQQPGWVAELSIQGVTFADDHYHVADLNDGSGGIVVTAWTDSPTFGPPGSRFAHVWKVLPVQADSRFGGALNTKQFKTVYAEGSRYQFFLDNPQETTGGPVIVKTWAEFVAPPSAQVRHGIWLSDAAWNAHVAVRTARGWRS